MYTYEIVLKETKSLVQMYIHIILKSFTFRIKNINHSERWICDYIYSRQFLNKKNEHDLNESVREIECLDAFLQLNKLYTYINLSIIGVFIWSYQYVHFFAIIENFLTSILFVNIEKCFSNKTNSVLIRSGI